MKREKKEVILYFISTSIISVLGFVLSILYSKMFSPSDYGIYSLAWSTYNLMLNIYAGWISSSIIRCFQEYKDKGKINNFYGTFLQLQFKMGLLFIAVPNIVVLLLNVNSLFKILFFILTLSYFFEESILIINTYLRAEKNVKQYNTNTILNNILKIVLVLLIYYIFGVKSVIAITITLVSTELIQYIYLLIKLKLSKYYSKKLFDKQIVKEMFRFGFPLIGTAVTSWILSTSDRYVIQFFWSSEEVGLYSYAYSLGNSLFKLLIQFIMLSAYPNIVIAWEKEGKEKTENVIRSYLRIYFLVLIPALVGVIGVAKDFFEAFTDIRYQSCYDVFILTCASLAVVGITHYTNKAWELTKKTSQILKYNVIVSLINIGLNILLIPLYGYKIAVITTLVSYFIYLIISVIKTRNILKLRINYKSLIKVIISSLCMFGAIICFELIPLNINVTYRLIIKIIGGVIVYSVFILLLREVKVQETIAAIKTVKKKILNK